ncbi:MAG: response regulator [Planctomycetota bacterium]
MTDGSILLVDDDFHIIQVLSLKLNNAKFQVRTASNGEEALERIEESVPDLLITDYSMPVMTGMELVKAVRAREDTMDLPIIMLTARGQTVEESDEPAPRIDLLMSKPFSPREILRNVQALLEKVKP